MVNIGDVVTDVKTLIDHQVIKIEGGSVFLRTDTNDTIEVGIDAMSQMFVLKVNF